MHAQRHPLIKALREGLAALADPARAPAMQAYMKSELPYYGVPQPDVRRLCRFIFAEHPLASAQELDRIVAQLFAEATHREERYAAIQLAEHRFYSKYQTPARLPLYRRLIVAGAWWDIVDEVASHLVGPLLLKFPDEVRPPIQAWITDQHLWLRRTSIIAQLGHKTATDLDLLTAAIDHNAADSDFFIRKAIGWALRQYARTDPEWVRMFVDEREETLSGLSKREARKHL